PQFRRKLEAVGYGVFIPVFFVATGINFDLEALTASASNLAMVPIFLAALVLVRGLPAIVYRRFVGNRKAVIAGVFQSTSLPFIVAATAIGIELGLIGAAESAALIGAGLLSVLIFPLLGLTLLRGTTGGTEPAPEGGPAGREAGAAPGGLAMGPREDVPAASR
ncbi:MAG: cation:proton antiporter, partial [Thermoleophilaceae bacterium]